ncbi:unnamed protein product [Arctogadus glacialis]
MARVLFSERSCQSGPMAGPSSTGAPVGNSPSSPSDQQAPVGGLGHGTAPFLALTSVILRPAFSKPKNPLGSSQISLSCWSAPGPRQAGCALQLQALLMGPRRRALLSIQRVQCVRGTPAGILLGRLEE